MLRLIMYQTVACAAGLCYKLNGNTVTSLAAGQDEVELSFDHVAGPSTSQEQFFKGQQDSVAHNTSDYRALPKCTLLQWRAYKHKVSECPVDLHLIIATSHQASVLLL